MRALLTLLITLSIFTANAQNWQCLQSGQRQYFTNGQHYLRGMRIDSVRAAGTDTIYYPYHTPRGFYLVNPNLDSTGGSWLGKAVVQRGTTFVFDNLWHDSTIIKTQASVGDTWTFYQDTTPLYYNATCIAKGTMTVLGAADSVSTILITAHNASGIVTTDPADSLEIILSKNHGFVQVFDLYTFPYHKPDSAYTMGIDYYLDNQTYLPSHGSILFTRINLYNPSYMAMEGWHTGDAFEYIAIDHRLVCSSSYPHEYTWFLDSVVSIATYPDRVEYSCVGWAARFNCWLSGYDTTHTSNTYTFYNNRLIIDTSLMPEEFKEPWAIYYIPGDTSYCMPGDRYKLYGTVLVSSAHYPTFYEAYGPFIEHKMNLGLITNHYENPAGWLMDDSSLIYYHQGSITCGTPYMPPLNIESVQNVRLPSGSFTCLPNPASDELTIKADITQPYTISLFNIVSQKVKSYTGGTQETTIPVGDLPPGVYNVSIRTESGATTNQKIVITH